MYQPPAWITTTGATTGTATLAITGLNAVHYLVAAATLVFFGLALLRLVPRREA